MGRIRSSRGFFILFGAFWCALLGVFDVVLVTQSCRQLDASRRFLPTTARILESSVESSSDSDGTTFRPQVAYEYEVAGRTYRSDTVHYAVWGSSDSSDAHDIVDRFPVGGEVTAYYDPSHPGTAILLPGTHHLPWFMALFLTPFHCVGIGVWIGVFTARAAPDAEVVLRNAIRSDDGTIAVLRSSRVPVWLVFLAVLGGGSFLAIFALALTVGMSAPARPVLGILAGLCSLAAVASLVPRARRRPDTVIDRARRTISRPGSLRADRFAVPESPAGFAEIGSITVESKPWGSVNDEPYFNHTIRAVRARNPEPMELVRVSGPAGFAEPLADWVREQIGLADRTDRPTPRAR